MVKSSEARILDPSCGSGGFLVQAYYKLARLLREKNPLATELEIHCDALHSVWGIDINRLPAYLAVENLNARNPSKQNQSVHVIVGDFFDLVPGSALEVPDKKLSSLTRADTLPGEIVGELPSFFDVIVANPPYVEQREIGDEEYKRRIRDVALTFDGVKIRMNARADIYAYFITHSTHLLKDRGKLGYIISDSWMNSIWGKDLQKFLLDNYAIKSIISFDRDVFDEALVETVVLIAEKLRGERFREERNANIVKFLRVKRPLATAKILKLAYSYAEENGSSATLSLVKQTDLHNEADWTKFFRNRRLLSRVEANPRLARLGDIGEISYLFKEGGYDFFVVKKEEASKWSIEPEFLHPIVSSPTHLDSIELLPKDIREYVLLVDKPKDELKGKKVLNYLLHGEKQNVTVKKGTLRGSVVRGYHNLPTFKGKQPWYSLRKGGPAHIILPAFVRNRFFAVKNSANALATANFFGLTLKNREDVDVILAYLNSSLASFLIENHARSSLGRGLLDIRSYMLRELRVLNPDGLDAEEKSLIRDAIDALYRVGKLESIEFRNAKRRMDDVIFDILQLGKSDRSRIIEELNRLRRNRKARLDSKILVRNNEEW